MLFNMMILLIMFTCLMFNYFQNIFILIISMLILETLTPLFYKEYWCMNTAWIFSDYLSFLLMMMSFIILLFCTLQMYSYKSKNLNMLLYNSSLFFLLFCFQSNNMMIFYIFFEASLIPLIFLILLKGNNLERFKANMYLIMYTLSGSFILLIILINQNYFWLNTMKYYMFKQNNYFWMMMLIVFLIKAPIYCFHSWLPKAHVEAPITGSMILAGILLKLGGFGVNRIFMMLNINTHKLPLNSILITSTLGALIVTFICCRQTDLKMLVAFSSISHMSLLMSSLMCSMNMSTSGANTMMLAHGFCSSGMFFMSGILYSHHKTRNMILMKSSFCTHPYTLIFWLMFSISNMSTPPSLNFLSEIIIVLLLCKKSLLMMIPLSIILIMTITYSLNIFISMSQGKKWNFKKMKNENKMEMLIMNFHIMYLYMYIMKTNLFLWNMCKIK